MKKLYLVVEGASDALILKHILPPTSSAEVQLVVATGEYGTCSMAMSLLAKRHAPVLVLINAGKNYPHQIDERKAFIQRFLSHSASPERFRVLIAIPSMEGILFKSPVVAKILLGSQFSDEVWNYAKESPKAFLDATFPSGHFLTHVLPRVSEQVKAVLQRDPLIEGMSEFIDTVPDPDETNFGGAIVERLKKEFHKEMLALYRKAGEETGYWPHMLLRRVRRSGGVEAAKYWLHQPGTSGLQRLTEINRLDLSVEALVLRQPWSRLFSKEERQIAITRLRELGFMDWWEQPTESVN